MKTRTQHTLGRFGITHYGIRRKEEQLWRVNIWRSGTGHCCIDFFMGRHLFAIWYDKELNK